MGDRAVVECVAIAAITAMEVANLMTLQLDGTLLSSLVGAVVFVATRRYYKRKYQK